VRCLSDDNVIRSKLIKFGYESESDKLLNIEGESGNGMDSIWWRDLRSVIKENGVEENCLTTSFWKEVWLGMQSLS